MPGEATRPAKHLTPSMIPVGSLQDGDTRRAAGNTTTTDADAHLSSRNRVQTNLAAPAGRQPGTGVGATSTQQSAIAQSPQQSSRGALATRLRSWQSEGSRTSYGGQTTVASDRGDETDVEDELPLLARRMRDLLCHAPRHAKVAPFRLDEAFRQQDKTWNGRVTWKETKATMEFLFPEHATSKLVEELWVRYASKWWACVVLGGCSHPTPPPEPNNQGKRELNYRWLIRHLAGDSGIAFRDPRRGVAGHSVTEVAPRMGWADGDSVSRPFYDFLSGPPKGADRLPMLIFNDAMRNSVRSSLARNHPGQEDIVSPRPGSQGNVRRPLPQPQPTAGSRPTTASQANSVGSAQSGGVSLQTPNGWVLQRASHNQPLSFAAFMRHTGGQPKAASSRLSARPADRGPQRRSFSGREMRMRPATGTAD